MHRHLSLHPLTSALAAAFFAAAVAPALAKAPTTGVVRGVDGKVYAHARVCVDRNHNARCDGNEASVFSDKEGKFKLSGGPGVVVAEIGKGSFLVDTATTTKVAVTCPLVFRRPEEVEPDAMDVDSLSSELQALIEESGSDTSTATAAAKMKARLGLSDPARDGLSRDEVRLRLEAERASATERIASVVASTGKKDDLAAALASRLSLERIETLVVIYAENRSFNNLFANFPGATGLPAARDAKKKGAPAFAPQKDRDGTVLAKLPPAWGGLTAAGQPLTVTQAQTINVWPNALF